MITEIRISLHLLITHIIYISHDIRTSKKKKKKKKQIERE